MEYLNIKCRDENLLPSRAHENDAGLDLLSDADIDSSIFADIRKPVMVPTGVSADIPDGYVGILSLRSSLGNRGFFIPNGVGVIDSGYQGEISVILNYLGDGEDEIKRGDRIAQLTIVPVVTPWVNVVDEFENESERGDGGFGSTGN